MNTPIIDFIKKYNDERGVRFHMPGHKGKPFLGFEALDITEIKGADSLYEAQGIIAMSEANASSLFGFGNTFYSTEGSSQCIRAMLYLALLNGKQNGNNNNTILAFRNVHKAFIQACALLNLSVEWVFPTNDISSLSQYKATPQQVKEALQNIKERPFALYITAPDYYGYSPNIREIAEICDKYNVPLLVDNAHGAYLKFLSPSLHPMDNGAFMSCDSAHKTLPVLTGGAYLHLSEKASQRMASQAKNALSMFGSTSPSYLILQSLDLCNKYLADNYSSKLSECIKGIKNAKDKLIEYGWVIKESDPLKIVIRSSSMGYSGYELADILGLSKIECEFADFDFLVLMLTPENDKQDLNSFLSAMMLPRKKSSTPQIKLTFSQGIAKMSIRQAMFAPHEIINVKNAVGRICASPAITCPPAIPIAVSGELITDEIVEILCAYNIEYIEVVAQ